MSSLNHKKRVVFFGTPDFAVAGLKTLMCDERFDVALVVTQPDKPAGRGSQLRASPVKALAENANIPILQPQSIRKSLADFLSSLQKYGPFDVGVVIAFGQILPQEVLDFPRHGCVNVHASLLPRWRGAAPMQRAILNGDKETGVCLMQMDAGLDTGAVFSSRTFTLNDNHNLQDVHDELAALSAEILKEDLIKITNAELTAIPQALNGVNYAEKVKNEEAKISWSDSASLINAKIRAFSPFPGAYCLYGDKRLKILKASVIEKNSSSPGKICFVDKSRLEVECGSAVLSILEVQMEGKKRMPINEFLKGFRLDSSSFFL